MAMIKCSGCGQKISDRAKNCIHCGKGLVEEKIKLCDECGKEVDINNTECPFCGCPLNEQELIDNSIFVKSISKINMKKLISPIVAVVIVAIIGLVIYNVNIVKPKNTYNEAIALLEKGKYDEASILLESVSGYKNVEEIQKQLKYESYAYSAINDVKKHLKNPNSYQPYEITFYESMENEENNALLEEGNVTNNLEIKKYPVCIMHYGAQNGFGGNTTGYALCSYSEDKKIYTLLGTCNSLDEDDYDEYDSDDVYKFMICQIINIYHDSRDTVGNIDLTRLQAVLKDDTYSTIKIIE